MGLYYFTCQGHGKDQLRQYVKAFYKLTLYNIRLKALPPSLGFSRPIHICHWYTRFRNFNLSLNIKIHVPKELISLKKKKKPSSSLIPTTRKAWRESIFIWKLPLKLLRLCSQSGAYNDATWRQFVYWIWCCCEYELHIFDFMAFFYVCKQHSVTWNISQLKCQQLNTQNGQSIFLHAYGQFLVLCERWEQSERTQRSKENQIRDGSGLKEHLQCSPLLYRRETEAQRGNEIYPGPHS